MNFLGLGWGRTWRVLRLIIDKYECRLVDTNRYGKKQMTIFDSVSLLSFLLLAKHSQ